MNQFSSKGVVRGSLYVVIVYQFIQKLLVWEKADCLVLLIPLLLQLTAHGVWFKWIKPWLLNRLAEDEERDAVLIRAEEVFLMLCILNFHFWLPYCLQGKYLLENRVILGGFLFAFVVWMRLFYQSIQGKLLHRPRKNCLLWGKILPVTLAALFVAFRWAETLSRNTAVALVAVVFTLECVVALMYNLKKHAA